VAVAQELLRRKADANSKDIKHETPIFKAAFLGHADAVDSLLSAGAGTNVYACCRVT
jgi:ankyrin repeat protein